jgi:hypothetical protein
MAKWLRRHALGSGRLAPVDSHPTLNALGTRTVNTPESGLDNQSDRISGGGRLSVDGPGELALADAQEYAGTIALNGSGLAPDSRCRAGRAGGGSYFHVDRQRGRESLTFGCGRTGARIGGDWRGKRSGRGGS